MSRFIDCITVEGFKSIERVHRLPLRPINVLIGPNGSGKTNLIEVLTLVDRIRSRRLDEYVIRSGGANRILHFGAEVTQEVRIGMSGHDHGDRYEITLATTASDGLSPVSEWGKHWPEISFLDTSMTAPIKRTVSVHDNRRLRNDGSNLAAFLYFLRSRERSAYRMIRRTVRLAIPFFDDFILEPQALDADKIRLEWRHRGSDAWFDASSLSDGSLRFIALATLLLQPTRLLPPLIMLDEPELGLHPYAITLLCALVKQATTKAQVILATQSPALLDHFEPEDVLVTERMNGRSQFNRLNRADLEEWLEDYSLGQLWEKNEIGGRPAREEGMRAAAR